MYYFKKLIDQNEVELISYVKQYLAAHQKENIKIHVGCDSQNIGSSTRSVEIANHLKEHGVHVNSVDLDFNSDEKQKSNKLVSASVGFVESMGLKANVKPAILPAISAADMMC